MIHIIEEILAEPETEQEPNQNISDLRDDLVTLKGQGSVRQILEAFPLLDEEGLDQEKHHCEWVLQQDRKRLHAMLFNPLQLLAQPELSTDSLQLGKPVAWIKTNGKEPRDWENYEYIWTHWKSGRISLDEAYGCWTWEDITHWMPASIKEPSKPRVDDEC